MKQRQRELQAMRSLTAGFVTLESDLRKLREAFQRALLQDRTTPLS